MSRAAEVDHAEVAPELKEAVLTALLRIKAETGGVPAVEVRRACAVLKNRYSERTIWRWVQRGEIPRYRREAWTPAADYRELLLRHGSVAELQRALDETGTESVSTRTMQRAFQREYGTVDMTFIRSGYKAAEAKMPTSAMPDLAINDEWSMDDTQHPVWCILPGGEIAKPQMEGIRDGGSRYLVSLNLSPYVFNTEDAVENLTNAIAGHTTEDGVFVGGKPRALRTDRGSIFISHATSLGLVAEGIARRYSEPYTPQQNGGIERWHRTIKTMFKDVPGFDWSDYRRRDSRKPHEPPPADQLLFFEELVVVTLEKVREYNTKRVHSAHGMTPQECWDRDALANPELVERADSVAIRASMRQSMTRTVTRRRVQWDKRFYNLHPQSVYAPDEDGEVVELRAKHIRAVEGRDVTVRFLAGRVEHVSVYTLQGEYLGDAVWDKIQTVAHAGETANARRQHIKTMAADLESIAIADAAGIAKRAADALANSGGLEEYEQYDDPDGDVCAQTSPFPSDEATPGRKVRTSKAGGAGNGRAKRTQARVPETREPTPRECREAQRRADAAAAAELVTRSRSN